MSTHESSGAHSDVKMGSERSFGFVFTAVFTLIALAPLFSGQPARLWALAVAATFGAVAFVRPALLKPLNRLWFQVGLLLHKVVTPLVMGLLYVVAVVPTGLVARAMGKDPLRLKADPSLSSYWIVREPPGPTPDSMTRQF